MARTRWKHWGWNAKWIFSKDARTVRTDILTGYNQKAEMTPQPYVLICLNLILPVILRIYLTFAERNEALKKW